MAGGLDLFAGSNSLTGTNLWKNDKDPLNELFEGVEDIIGEEAQALGRGIQELMAALLSALGQAIVGGLEDAIGAAIPALREVEKFFTNLENFFDADFLDPFFNIPIQAENFINNVLAETGLLPILDGFGHLAAGDVQPLIDAISAGFGGAAGLGYSGLQSFLVTIPGAQQLIDTIYDTLTGTHGTGHTVLEVAGALEDIPANFIHSVFPGASSLGDEIQNFFGSTFPKVFPFIFGTSTATTLTSLVSQTQFQQLVDGLVGNGSIGNSVQAAVGSLQVQIDQAVSGISQAVLDGIHGANVSTGISAALQAIPNLNVTSALGLQSLGADIQQTVTSLFGGLNILPQVLAGVIPALDASIITTGAFAQVQLQGLINAISQGFGGAAGLGFSALQSFIGGLPTAQGVIDQIYDTITSTAGTGHTLGDLALALLEIPSHFVQSVFGGASLGADIQGFMTALGSTFPKVFPFTFGVSTATTLASFVPNDQFQQLVDGLVGNGSIGNTIGAAVGALQVQIDQAVGGISQAVLDGIRGANINTGISAALQAIPNLNITSALGLQSLGADIQQTVTSLFGGLNILPHVLAGVIPALDASIITTGQFVSTQLQGLIDSISQAFGGATGLGFAALQSFIGGLPNAQNVIDNIYDTITGTGGTGHTLGDLVTAVQEIPSHFVQSVFGGANLGTEIQAFLGSTFPKVFPFTFGVSTATTLTSLVSQGQFQQLVDGLVGNGSIGNTVAAAVGALQVQIDQAVSGISQAVLDGIHGANVSTGISAALQAIPNLNVTSALGLQSLGADIQQTVTSLFGGLTILPQVLAGAIPALDASIITTGAFAQAQLQSLINAVSQGFGGALGLGFSGLQSFISGLPTAQGVIDNIYDTITGTGGTGHSLVDLAVALAEIPAHFVQSIFGGSNLGADVQGFMTALGSTFPKVFPFAFGVSTATTLASFVPNDQFQQLVDGLVGNGSIGNPVGAAVGALQVQIDQAVSGISQAVLDGIHGANINTGISQALQAIPNLNVTSALGLQSLGTDIQQTVAALFGGGSILSKIQTSIIPQLNASIINAGTFLSSLIPSLDASIITTGTFLISQISSLGGYLTHLTSGGLFDAAQLTGTLASAILVQIVNALIALFPNLFGGLPGGLTGLGNVFTDLVNSMGITGNLGSGSPVLQTLAANIPVLGPAIAIVQGVADGVGQAVQGASGFVQTVVTDATTAEAAIQAQIQAVIPFVIPHFW